MSKLKLKAIAWSCAIPHRLTNPQNDSPEALLCAMLQDVRQSTNEQKQSGLSHSSSCKIHGFPHGKLRSRSLSCHLAVPKLFWLVCTGNKFALHCGPENTQPTPGGYFIPCTQKEQQTASLPTLDLSDLLEPRSRLGIHRHITQTRRKRIFVSRES